MDTRRHAALGCLVAGTLLLAGCGSSSTGDASAQPAASSTSSRQAGEAERQVPTSGSPSAAASQPSGSASKAVAPTAEAQGSSSASPTTGGSALPTPSGTLKKFDTATLPTSIGSYSGQVTSQGATKLGMYTGASQDKMLMVSLVKGGDMQALASHLQGAATMGHAVCGKQDGTAACVLPLQGGYGHVQGTNDDSVETIAKLSNQLWDKLA